MTFDPQSVHTTTGIATAAVILIYILVLAALILAVLRNGNEDKLAEKDA